MTGIAVPHQYRHDTIFWISVRPNPSANPLALECYPNPSNGSFSLILQLPQATITSITIVDPLGRVIANPLPSQVFSSGTHTVSCNVAGLTAGTYLAIAKTTQGIIESKFVLQY
jgi:hypothetical protein